MFSARWMGKKGVITHSAGLAWDQNPGSGSRSTEIWTPDILNSISSNTATSGMSLSPKITGEYNFYPSDKIFISSFWAYQYTHNNSSSFYQSSSLVPILNGTKEDVHGVRVAVNPHVTCRMPIRYSLPATTTIACMMPISMVWMTTVTISEQAASLLTV